MPTANPPLRVFVADDEPLARKRLTDLLSREPDVEVVAKCTNGTDAEAADYLLKPCPPARLHQALNRARALRASEPAASNNYVGGHVTVLSCGEILPITRGIREVQARLEVGV